MTLMFLIPSVSLSLLQYFTLAASIEKCFMLHSRTQMSDFSGDCFLLCHLFCFTYLLCHYGGELM